MEVSCRIVNAQKKIYEIVTNLEGKDKVQGHIQFDIEKNEWMADELLTRCLELFTSDKHTRKGRLGTDFQMAKEVAIEVAAAWELVSFEGSRSATLKIPKLDMEKSSAVLEIFPNDRPLKDLKVEHVN